MKYQIMIGILFTLLSKRKTSAGELAAKFGISLRTVYRYIDEMTCSNIPIDVARGANGGIYISDAYKLPKGMMTKEEYARATEAMLAMHAQTGDPVLQSAIDKLTAQSKSERADVALAGNILVDGGTWGDRSRFSEKLSFFDRMISEKRAVEIDYIDRGGERTRRVILPHLLVYKQNLWYVYAWCRLRGDFRLFKLGRMKSVLATEENFEPVPFRREDVPLGFWLDYEKRIEAKFAIAPEALPFAEEWLGIENVYKRNDGYYADVVLPDDESLLWQLLAAGSGFKVIEPPALAERVRAEAEKIARQYSNG